MKLFDILFAMKVKGINHVELSVTDLQRSKNYYEKLPNFKIVAEYPNFIMFSCGDFRLGLTDHAGKLTSHTFSEYNIGLDHISFTLASSEDLDEALAWLNEHNIPHGEIKILSNNSKVLAFRDPDNIQLEFTYKPE